MDHLDAGVDLLQPVLRRVAPRRRAVVHDPAQAVGRALRCLGQHVVPQAATGLDASGRFTPAHDVPPADVPGGQIVRGWHGPTQAAGTSGREAGRGPGLRGIPCRKLSSVPSTCPTADHKACVSQPWSY
jgi:hypothetical protein